jgi:enoyl-CoA hydratase/carnithine racemase
VATVESNQTAVAGLVTMRKQLVARLQGVTPGGRCWVMQMLDVRISAAETGSSVSLRVPPQMAATVPGKDESEVSFPSCRP